MTTDRYTRWLQILAVSDAALVQLLVVALIVVALWEIVRRLPQPWQSRLQVVALGEALVVFGYLLMLVMFGYLLIK